MRNHLLLILLILSIGSIAQARESRASLNINPAWRFQLGDPKEQPLGEKFDDFGWDIVSLPHSHFIFTANMSGFSEFGRTVGWYRREIQIKDDWQDKRVFLEFRGSMQKTALWVNGKKVGNYSVSGYDSFSFDITAFVQTGKNTLAVRVDNTVSRDNPPDGTTTDYILFGGLYRDVFLHVTDSLHLTFPWEARQAGVRITFPSVSVTNAVVRAEATVRNDSTNTRHCALVFELNDRDGKTVKTLREEKEIAPNTEATFTQQTDFIEQPHLWSPDAPYLYQLSTKVIEDGRVMDSIKTPFGVRWVKFDKKQGFLLNGKQVKLIGVNYHQSWPFIGSAVPDTLHRRDMEQIKAMGVNWVRLSHYPHDPALLDALDELGLMALEEPPTWMNSLPGTWSDNLEASFRSMIRRDRNHPSIIIWGACVNHKGADPRLVKAAREEDPARDRGQDTVMTPMCFEQMEVPEGGGLCIEHTGHTFPTKRGVGKVMPYLRGDQNKLGSETSVRREYAQARRHWEQINAADMKPENAGLAVWCMYDYNTFYNVNEPGLVWHGVCDLFRIPKESYWWHVSELGSKPMAHVVPVDENHVAVFCNYDEVRLSQDIGIGYKEVLKKKVETGFTTWKGQPSIFALRHPPYLFTVTPGARAIKAEALENGEVRAVGEWKRPGLPVTLKLEADRATITADGADLSRIIVSAVDENGTSVEDCALPVTFTIQGLGQLIGENPVNLRAGKMIILAQSGFVPDTLTITASANGLRAAQTTVTTVQAPPNVDIPKDLPVKQPTLRKPAVSSKKRN